MAITPLLARLSRTVARRLETVENDAIAPGPRRCPWTATSSSAGSAGSGGPSPASWKPRTALRRARPGRPPRRHGAQGRPAHLFRRRRARGDPRPRRRRPRQGLHCHRQLAAECRAHGPRRLQAAAQRHRSMPAPATADHAGPAQARAPSGRARGGRGQPATRRPHPGGARLSGGRRRQRIEQEREQELVKLEAGGD